MPLERENEILSQQVKRLVRAETRLYQYQEELDAQLKEYKELYELNRKLATMFDIGKIFHYTLDYVINNLDYERAIIFTLIENSGDYRVYDAGGYYDPNEKNTITGLTIRHDALFLRSLREGREYLVCAAACEEKDLVELRDRMGMNEYLIYPLATDSRPFYALLAAGNSAGNADYYRKVEESHGTLVSMGNLVGAISSAIEKSIYFGRMEKALEQERLAEKKYRSIFENAVEGIFRRTMEGQYLDVNRAMARMLGYGSPEELIDSISNIGQQVYVYPERQAEIIRRLEEHGIVEGFETQLYRKDRSVIWVSVSARVMRDDSGKALYYEGTAEEITDRKLAEQERERLIADLERSNAELSRFAYVASHDLQEPLRTVARYVELLARRYHGHLDPTADKFIGFAVEGAKRMYELINDLLAYYHVDTKGSRFQPVAMDSAVRQALSVLGQTVEEQQAEVTMDAMPVVMGEAEQLTELMQYLLDNALKFRRDDVRPNIHVSVEQRNNEWVFGVHDNGIGIEPEYLERIFIIFQRLHVRPAYTGTGVGLAICRKIVEWHGGRIWAESKYGEGSSFFFTLPVKREGSHVPQQERTDRYTAH